MFLHKSIFRFGIVLTCFCLQSKVAYSQDFGAVGTTWYFSAPNFIGSAVDYTEIVSINDTAINAQPCHHLRRVHGSDCFSIDSDFYVYGDSDRAYYFVKERNQFSLLYDFNLIAGDTLKGYVNSQDSFMLYVDGVAPTLVNGQMRKELFCYELTLYAFSTFGTDILIEGIGSRLGYLFPQYGACDPVVVGLRCFEDSAVGLYSTNVAPSCDYISTSVQEINSGNENQLSIFPNPAASIISLQGKISSPYSILISDLSGKILWEGNSVLNKTIDLNFFPAGIYFLKVKQLSEEQVMKVIKQ